VRLYPTLPRRRRAAILGDLAVIALIAVFAWLGLRVYDSVASLASIGREVQATGRSVDASAREAAGAVRGGFGEAADTLDGVPLVGEQVAEALRSAGNTTAAPLERQGRQSGGQLAAVGREAEAQTLRTARVLGWVTFLMPTVLLLALVLPSRVARVRTLSVAQRALQAGGPLDPERERALAQRAAFSLPYGALLAYTPDPMGDLVAGRHDRLIAALAADAGLRPADLGARR
jgi:hypothetical protein